MRRPVRLTLAFLILLCLWEPTPAHAYIGPGAGFAFVGSFFALFFTFLLSFAKLLTAPVRAVWRWLRWRKALAKSRVRKVIVLGLDGQDPVLTDRFLAEGLLPNFARLREQGGYARLATSFPAESPVAWSSFQTGCNPGKHKIFDFLVPNRKSHLPELCSAKVTGVARTLKLGKYRIPLGQPLIDLGRKSQSFWKLLGDHGIFSAVLRVPITFPAEKFRGVLLSAMCVPDLKGSQGTFSYYSDEPAVEGAFTGGMRFPVKVEAGVVRGKLSGPQNTMVENGGDLTIPFEVCLGPGEGAATLSIAGKSWPLRVGEYTPWIELKFKPGLGISVRGIARFRLLATAPHFRLYVTPIQIDPDKPAMPISYPSSYATYLSKLQGRYATLGLAEDTWGLNERVLDEQAFLDQAWLIHAEREAMFFDALEKVKRGAVVCVFDITDRLQHMFFRYLDADHPANAGKDVEQHAGAIRDLYVKMDDLLGRVMATVKPGTQLFVMSDHGFKPFRRGVNLNTWLWQNGFLALKGEAPTGREWYQDVDWSRTRAYAVGLGGIYINVKGREAKGIVAPGDEQAAVKREIAAGLAALGDAAAAVKREIAAGLAAPGDDTAAVRRENAAGPAAPGDGNGDGALRPIAAVYDTRKIYSGPYVGEAPDLFVGFSVGYRASWECATGTITPDVLSDNTKSWSGDHCMNPPDVPGIFLSNAPLPVDTVNIMDIGPTVLDLFGVPVPEWCDGRSFMPAPGAAGAAGAAGGSAGVAAESTTAPDRGKPAAKAGKARRAGGRRG